MIKYSIIIPVFNAADTILRCLESIFKQESIYLFEVIAVDDFSTDNSRIILHDIAKSESRLKIIFHERNLKLSRARSTGIQKASGEYILHVDADDFLLPGFFNMVDPLLSAIQPDTIIYNILTEVKPNKTQILNAISSNNITTDKRLVQKYFTGTTVNKIVKASILKDLEYSKVSLNSGEDFIYSCEILCRSEKICLIAHPLYFYSFNVNSITRKISVDDYINNRITILTTFHKISTQYNLDKVIVKLYLSYITRSLITVASRNIFTIHNKIDMTEICNELKKFDLDKKYINQVSRQINHRYYNILAMVKYYGFYRTIVYIYRNFSLKN